ncbi:MAG: RNA methyltransferase [Alphaproteobacteria bacterium]|nr:RNA methyltransferase [Alphaproteobacteria bacterium]
MTRRSPSLRSAAGGHWLYGLHAVRAALANPMRKRHRAVLTKNAMAAIGQSLLDTVRHELAASESVARLVPAGAVHQGVALLCEALPNRALEAVLDEASGGPRVLVVLDQISDPHNVGANLRSAAVFGASGVIVQDRHGPAESGVLAKAASGALDLIPYIHVVNISRALQQLARLGFWRLALSGDGEQPLATAVPDGDTAIVLGSEGAGIRRLVREHCDVAAFIPAKGAIQSLNVSNAAAIALYAWRSGARGSGRN